MKTESIASHEANETQKPNDEKNEKVGEAALNIARVTDAEWKERNKPKIKSEIEYHANEMLTLRHDFQKALRRKEEAGEKMSEQDFCKWEQWYADEYKYIQDDLEKIDMRAFYDKYWHEQMYFEASAGRDIALVPDKEISKTIEAQAGHFFYERSRALNKAINESDKDEAEKKKDKETITNFIKKSVSDYLYYRTFTDEEKKQYGAEWLEANRTATHNYAVLHLNRLNRLCEKYGTTPFICRNLWPSSAMDKEFQTPDVSIRLHVDRECFVDYCGIAFRDLWKKISKEHQERANNLDPYAIDVF